MLLTEQSHCCDDFIGCDLMVRFGNNNGKPVIRMIAGWRAYNYYIPFIPNIKKKHVHK